MSRFWDWLRNFQMPMWLDLRWEANGRDGCDSRG